MLTETNYNCLESGLQTGLREAPAWTETSDFWMLAGVKRHPPLSCFLPVESQVLGSPFPKAGLAAHWAASSPVLGSLFTYRNLNMFYYVFTLMYNMLTI